MYRRGRPGLGARPPRPGHGCAASLVLGRAHRLLRLRRRRRRRVAAAAAGLGRLGIADRAAQAQHYGGDEGGGAQGWVREHGRAGLSLPPRHTAVSMQRAGRRATWPPAAPIPQHPGRTQDEVGDGQEGLGGAVPAGRAKRGRYGRRRARSAARAVRARRLARRANRRQRQRPRGRGGRCCCGRRARRRWRRSGGGGGGGGGGDGGGVRRAGRGAHSQSTLARLVP
jgi:hypothetical protein